MKQKIVKVLLGLLITALLIAAILYHAIYISPEKVRVRYDTVTSSKIPDSLNNVTIGYFSDIYYLGPMNQERLQNMFDEMNEAHVDILLFGGDLFANPTSEEINADVISSLTNMLLNLEAPLGKFYVLGDLDNQSNDSKTLVSNILYNAGFEELTNKNIKLHNGNMDSVTLIGLDNMVNGNPDIQTAFSATSDKSLNILFTHTPDAIASLSIGTVDVAIAGHSLGGQIRVPLLGSLKPVEGAQRYSHGTYTYNGNLIRISNGLGTKEADMRLFCPPEFNILVLQTN